MFFRSSAVVMIPAALLGFSEVSMSRAASYSMRGGMGGRFIFRVGPCGRGMSHLSATPDPANGFGPVIVYFTEHHGGNFGLRTFGL